MIPLRLLARLSTIRCNASRCLSFSQRPKHSKSLTERLDPGPDDFLSWQQGIRADYQSSTAARGLTEFNEDVYNKQFQISISDGEERRDKMVEGLMAAIDLYKQRQPRLRQDHPQFVQWCIDRMIQYEVTDNIEIYESLFECFPRHMYYAPGMVERLFPKHNPGFFAAFDLINTANKFGRLRPSFTLYRNAVRSFGKRHIIVAVIRKWGWWHHIMRKANPYPLPDGGYEFRDLAARSRAETAAYVADRIMDQSCKMTELTSRVGEYLGTAIVSQTQRDLSILQTPNDNMRITGPHSIWMGDVQQWYWVLRREERGDEFEGAPLGVVLSPYKEMSKIATQQWLEDSKAQYKGIGGSNIVFDAPEELLAIDYEEHFKERVSLFSDGIEEVTIESSILPKVQDGQTQNVKKLNRAHDVFKFRRDKDLKDKDDEW